MLIVLGIGFVSAVIGALMASGRNRNPLTWAVICFIFPLIGIMFLLVSGADTTMNSNDRKRWETLCEADEDIALAADKARDVSPECEAMFAEKYMVLNEKKYIQSLLKSTIKQFTDEIEPQSEMHDEIDYLKSMAADGLISRDELHAKIIELAKK